jgi:hypothetical protein
MLNQGLHFAKATRSGTRADPQPHAPWPWLRWGPHCFPGQHIAATRLGRSWSAQQAGPVSLVQLQQLWPSRLWQVVHSGQPWPFSFWRGDEDGGPCSCPARGPLPFPEPVAPPRCGRRSPNQDQRRRRRRGMCGARSSQGSLRPCHQHDPPARLRCAASSDLCAFLANHEQWRLWGINPNTSMIDPGGEKGLK